MYIKIFADLLIGGNCGGDLTADEGEISSPNWPSPYNANQDCEWNINVSRII